MEIASQAVQADQCDSMEPRSLAVQADQRDSLDTASQAVQADQRDGELLCLSTCNNMRACAVHLSPFRVMH